MSSILGFSFTLVQLKYNPIFILSIFFNEEPILLSTVQFKFAHLT